MNIRNLKIVKEKVMPLLAAGTLALSLSSCAGSVDLSNLTIDTLVADETVQEVTLIDEMLEEGRLIYDEGMSVVAAADTLERYMNLVDKFKYVDFEDVSELKPLTEEECINALSLTDEEIVKLIRDAELSGKNMSLLEMEKKIDAQKKLNYLNNYCKNWIRSNGQRVSIDIMMAAVKASIASEFGIETSDYSKIVIPPSRGTDPEGPNNRSIEIGEESYIIPRSSTEIINTIDYIYAVQIYEVNEATEFATYRKAINLAKTTIAAGANVKNGNIESQYDSEFIEKHFTK